MVGTDLQGQGELEPAHPRRRACNYTFKFTNVFANVCCNASQS